MKQPSSPSFFHSLSFKLYIGVVGCVLVLLLTNLLFNNLAFSDHYRDTKQKTLTDTFAVLSNEVTNGAQLAAFLETRPAEPAMLLWDDHRILCHDPSIPLPSSGSPFHVMAPLDLQNGSYTVSDRPLRAQAPHSVLTLYGKTPSGLNVVMQLSMADMEENRALLNRFWGWSALITLVLSGGVFWWLRYAFARPVGRLSAMAHRISQQDLRERYAGNRKDEIAVLGTALNRISETMEQTLAQLKTADARLLSDTENSERQNEARRVFISNVSHELKTPIALIQTYAEGLKEQVAESEEERAFYCDVISDEAGRLSQMVSRMTMLMQLESGKEELQIDRFEMRALCERLLERYAPLFAERQIPLPALSSDDGWVWGDAALIEHVLTNYLTNALNHTPNGGEITVTWATVGDRLRVTVFNSDSHIPEEELPRIWESFYKVDKARTRAYGGSGIGLSVAAAIMRVHRMPYGVHNTNRGVEFYFELPTM